MSFDAGILVPVTFLLVLVALYLVKRASSKPTTRRLADTTLLIIRHSEKPASGRLLSKAGYARAEAYASYFDPFHHGNLVLKLDTLIAGSDSKRSKRPRLTLEPLSQFTGIPIDDRFTTNDSAALATHLHRRNRGKAILICWRHNQIAPLLTALGADPDRLLPSGKWPTDLYDAVILLRFDGSGRLVEQQCVKQPELLLPM
jgi:hypothetical protein